MENRITPTKAAISVVLLLFAALCIMPFWLVLVGSFTLESEIIRNGFSLWPKTIDFTAYKYLAADSWRIINGYKISILVTVLGTFMSLFITALAAYPMSKADLKLAKFINMYVLFTMIFNGGMVPWFIVCRNILGLKDNIWALILPYLCNAWYMFLIRNYFKGIPAELSESAKIDGAGEYRIFFQIILPLAKPVIATVGLFICLMYWNDWWLGIMLIDKTDLQPLQLLLRTITSNIQFLASSPNASAMAEMSVTIPGEGIKMAICIVTIGPIVLVYPFIQKYFVKGIMVGAVKG